MLLVLHAVLYWPLSGFQFQHLLVTGMFTSHVPLSPVGDIKGEGSVLPGSGLWSGSLLLLSTHPQEHHQADLLL